MCTSLVLKGSPDNKWPITNTAHLPQYSLCSQSDVDKVALEGELAFVSRRLREYETGDYGLGEAVAEIKRRKEDIATRDR